MNLDLPEPVRAAAGLAARTLDEARRLPQRLLGLPVQLVGTAMQVSLRAQQEYAALVARGDEVLVRLGASADEDDVPPWATFDEPVPPAAPDPDEDPPPAPVRPGGVTARGRRASPAPGADPLAVVTPKPAAETAGGSTATGAAAKEATPRRRTPTTRSTGNRSTARKPAATGTDRAAEPAEAPGPTAHPDYPSWTLPQLRARLATMPATEVADLLAHEEAAGARAAYLTMLQNRLVTLGRV